MTPSSFRKVLAASERNPCDTIIYFNSWPKGQNPWDLFVSSFSKKCLYHDDENWIDHLTCIFSNIPLVFSASQEYILIRGELPHINTLTLTLTLTLPKSCASLLIPDSLTGDSNKDISYYLENCTDYQSEWNLVEMGVRGLMGRGRDWKRKLTLPLVQLWTPRSLTMNAGGVSP